MSGQVPHTSGQPRALLGVLAGLGYAALWAWGVSFTFPARMAASMTSTYGASILLSLILPVTVSAILLTAVIVPRGPSRWSFAIAACLGSLLIWLTAKAI